MNLIFTPSIDYSNLFDSILIWYLGTEDELRYKLSDELSNSYKNSDDYRYWLIDLTDLDKTPILKEFIDRNEIKENFYILFTD